MVIMLLILTGLAGSSSFERADQISALTGTLSPLPGHAPDIRAGSVVDRGHNTAPLQPLNGRCAASPMLWGRPVEQRWSTWVW